jgi:hypothetical protein
MSDVTMTPLDELLIDEATQGLATAERAELQRLLEVEPGIDRSAFAYSCAVLDVVLATAFYEPMPAHVQARLRDIAETRARRRTEPSSSSSSSPSASAPPSFAFSSIHRHRDRRVVARGERRGARPGGRP